MMTFPKVATASAGPACARKKYEATRALLGVRQVRTLSLVKAHMILRNKKHHQKAEKLITRPLLVRHR